MTRALAFLATVAAFHLVPAIGGAHTGDATIALHLALTAWMLYFWHRAGDGCLSIGTTIMLGVVARLLLIPVAPFTTHDVERYLWDGAVLLAGIDPYLVAPDDAAVASLREAWPTPAEHGAYATLYPPLALGLFALSALAGPVGGLWLWKSLIALASIATLFVTAMFLRRIGHERHLALIAFSPLMLLEAGVGAHVDAFSTLCLSAALLAVSARRWGWVGVAVGLGTAFKLLPLLMLGPLLASLSWRRWSPVLTGTAAGLAIPYGAAMMAGLTPLGSLGVFFEKWRFGSPLYDLLAHLDGLVAIPLLAVLLTVLACWYARQDLYMGLLGVLSVPLLLSPVVFPWYLLPLVPLLGVRPNLLTLVWLTLAPLSYEVLNAFNATGEWSPAPWPL
ncbi:MAG: glycosyltransferase 87 family protein, partial [Pseudomonadota bacterium]